MEAICCVAFRIFSGLLMRGFVWALIHAITGRLPLLVLHGTQQCTVLL